MTATADTGRESLRAKFYRNINIANEDEAAAAMTLIEGVEALMYPWQERPQGYQATPEELEVLLTALDKAKALMVSISTRSRELIGGDIRTLANEQHKSLD